MIQWVIDNIRPSRPHRFIFICLDSHMVDHPEVPDVLRRLAPGCEIITVDRITEGAACTVLLARKLIDSDDSLMIANSDQFVEVNIDDYLAEGDAVGIDGHIMTFYSDHPKWSYCRIARGLVAEVVEKKVISNVATVGIYNFKRGGDFVAAADAMIASNLRVNGEFYVAPAYNILIGTGARIMSAIIEKPGLVVMHGLGTPEDFYLFQKSEAFIRRTGASH